jgi:hypothetical protein
MILLFILWRTTIQHYRSTACIGFFLANPYLQFLLLMRNNNTYSYPDPRDSVAAVGHGGSIAAHPTQASRFVHLILEPVRFSMRTLSRAPRARQLHVRDGSLWTRAATTGEVGPTAVGIDRAARRAPPAAGISIVPQQRKCNRFRWRASRVTVLYVSTDGWSLRAPCGTHERTSRDLLVYIHITHGRVNT